MCVFFCTFVGKFMIRVVTYDQIDRTAWQELVRKSETGTWFQSPEAYDFYASLPAVMRPFVIAVERVNEFLARFDVMGAGKPNVPYGVRDFKAEFGGQLVEHGRFLHICQPFLYRIGTLGVRLLKQH